MKPWQFPSGQWIDLDSVQTITPVMESTIPGKTKSSPVTKQRWFSITIAFQNAPLVIQIVDIHSGAKLTAEQWEQACKNLESEREVFINAWRGTNAVELVFDATSVRNHTITDNDQGYSVALTLHVDKNAAGTGLVDYIRNLPVTE